MEFWQIVSANICGQTVSVGFVLWMCSILLGRLPDGSSGRRKKGIFLALFLVLVWSVTAAGCYLGGVWSWKYNLGRILWEYFVLAGYILLLRVLYCLSFRSCLLSAVIIAMLSAYGELLAEVFCYGRVFDLNIPAERLQYLFWFLLISPICLLFSGLVISKSGAGKIYSQWVQREEMGNRLVILIGLYPVFNQIIQWLPVNRVELDKENLLISLAFLLVLHLIFVYVGRDWQQKQYIAAQEASLRQQTVYIEKMEQIQSELRRFRHDFRNMMAGMFLQAEEGGLTAVQSYIQEMTDDFDRQVGDQVQLMNQLANVHMVEAKGLLLEKLIGMQQKRIRVSLEVLRPVYQVPMRSTDLLRCLGILIDNAIEAVQGREEGEVCLMISSQEDCITFRIKNTLYEAIDFGKLETAGYSTKGKDRGVGLSSYRKILENYDFVFPFTAVQEGYFVQELKIQQR